MRRMVRMGLRFDVHVYDLKFFFFLFNGVATGDTFPHQSNGNKNEKGKDEKGGRERNNKSLRLHSPLIAENLISTFAIHFVKTGGPWCCPHLNVWTPDMPLF